MKTFTLLLIVIAPAAATISGCAGPALSTASDSSDERVVVSFENPANFTDVKADPMDKVEESYLERIRRHLQERAVRYLEPGERLSVTFTDFDMAGEFEPWRVNAARVRLVKPIYPPRAKFNWVIFDASGQIVRQGQEALVDTGFTQTARDTIGDPLYYEKLMLDSWMQRALR